MSYALIDKKNLVGRVLELFVSKKGDSQRVLKQDITLDKNGVLEDKFYGKEPNRSVLITSLYSYQLAKDRGISVEHGSLGENILIDYNLYHLHIGVQIGIGEVILEISQNCTLCKSLTKIDSSLPKLLKDDRGVFARVIKSGFIYRYDKIYKI
jgi:MOSC domain-containing protein YiiM